MYRHRQLCCRQEKLDIGIDACIKDCGKDDDGFDEYASCNEYCHHGGYFHRENTGSHYNYGHCICSQKYAGTCCDIRKYGISSFVPVWSYAQ